ncbi:acyltransferase domain-containing protein [Nocardiopsis dassonvillei subsp. albirubida]|uniref:Acyltransferase domain-containing protein n=2 Tax=Nocardiopsis alborubida TaxID=146802 RepID=A0A7X6MC35_9ACTN|nr:acyltransferase domain-containing protein [Nocardiopsis alborubida]
MGAGLYGGEPVFSATMDEFFARTGSRGSLLRDVWLSPSPGAALDESAHSQPLLFAVGHALGRAVTARMDVDALLGHSVGELAAAATAGVFTTAEGAGLMEARSRALRLAPEGGMLVVAAAPDQLREHMPDGVVVGALNNPRQTVLCGPRRSLRALAGRLLAKGFACDFARSSHAFHSPLCTPSAQEFEKAFDGVALARPVPPVHSARHGGVVTDRQAVSGAFWARQLDHPVLFSAAADGLLAHGRHLILEAGPRGSCVSLLKRNRLLRATRSRVEPLLAATEDGDALAAFELAVNLAAETRNVSSERSPNAEL